MSQKQIEILQRALKREKAARHAAEQILEVKARELYIANQKLTGLLDETTSQLEGVFENILDAYVIMDLEGNVIKFNESATKLFGYNLDKEQVNVSKLVYKDDFEYAISSFIELTKKGFFKDYEARVYTKSKEIKWVHINASVIFDKDNKPVAAQGVVRDITDQKKSEYKLIESEKRLSTLVLNLDSGIILEDENQKIVLTNNKFCKLFNLDEDPADLIGMDCTTAAEHNKELFKDPKTFLKRMNEIDAAKKTVISEELEMLDGKIIERGYLPIKTDGRYTGYLWTFTDVTLKKAYNKSLEAQKQKYYNIIANMNLGIIEVNTKGQILMINQSFSEMSGYQESELLGKCGKDIFPLDKSNTKTLQSEIDRRQKGKSNSYEVKVKTKSGEAKHWLVSAAPNLNLEGEISGSIAVTLDITDFTNLQIQKEILLEKLEKSNNELQEYAHIVSHDLKSPLRSINALVSWLKEDNNGKLDAVSLQNFGLIETTLEKMEMLITDVLNYSSLGSDIREKTEVNLDVLINELITILYIPEHISVKIINPLPCLKGDKTKLQQLFQNLISNAVKFIDKEVGDITIDVEDLKSHYKFSIQDNGIGIDKKYYGKIFKIFHSLKKSKESTGIGLSIVKKIVDLHEGEIWLESEPKVGTTFYFTLKK